MTPTKNPKLTAVLQALLVTFLWSTSWVLVKFGLEDIPPLIFAGLRYFLAFLLLLPFYLRAKTATPLHQFTRQEWGLLLALGLVYYTLTQGSQFVGLQYLPAILFSLLLNFTAPVTALLGIAFLQERLSLVQWAGIGVFLAGVAVYFFPLSLPAGIAFGLLVAVINVLANSVSSILGRFVNRTGHIDSLSVTVVSMGIGGTLLLLLGLLVEDLPRMSLANWGIVLWLAAVNTAFAFWLWNQSLRTLTAAESSIINNTMLVQIAILAWLFLGERPGVKEWAGMAVVIFGVILVNWRTRPREEA